VLLPIRQDVDENVSYLARRYECSRVISVRPDGAAPPEGTIHGASHANRDAAESDREASGVVGFDHEMDMVVLNTEMNDPEVIV